MKPESPYANDLVFLSMILPGMSEKIVIISKIFVESTFVCYYCYKQIELDMILTIIIHAFAIIFCSFLLLFAISYSNEQKSKEGYITAPSYNKKRKIQIEL